MYDHPDAQDCAEELRAALAAHGITLPSLGIDLLLHGRARKAAAPDAPPVMCC